MRRTILALFMAVAHLATPASTTLPMKGTIVKPTDKNIQYIGRICFQNPERPRFTLLYGNQSETLGQAQERLFHGTDRPVRTFQGGLDGRA